MFLKGIWERERTEVKGSGGDLRKKVEELNSEKKESVRFKTGSLY